MTAKRERTLRGWTSRIVLGTACAALVAAQQSQTLAREGVQQQSSPTASRSQRAQATREFLGLGAVPDKVAAARGKPLFQQNCGFCHGQNARGATAPALITSDVVLSDDHGELLAAFLKAGRPEKGMPAFKSMTERQRIDIAEFLHLEIENVANRGAYLVLNIVVGDAAKGKAYVESHCTQCHVAGAFTHVATRYRSPEQLQRGWIWPAGKSAITAEVKTPKETLTGRVVQISDFRITLVNGSGTTIKIDRGPGVEVHLDDPLAAHEQMLQTLANDAMHNVTAYLEMQK